MTSDTAMTSSAPVPFTADVVQLDGVTAVLVKGELDIDSAPILDETLSGVVASGALEVVLDLSRLGFLDSTGLGLLVKVQKRLTSRGGRLVLRSPAREPLKALEVTGLIEYLNVEISEPGG